LLRPGGKGKRRQENRESDAAFHHVPHEVSLIGLNGTISLCGPGVHGLQRRN
jgi:hypothetical protein